MRVTLNHSYATTLRNIAGRTTEYQRAMEVATSGKQVDAPSADPAGYNRVLGGRNRLSVLETYERNIGFAMSEANFADGTLQTVQNALSQVAEKATAGVSETLPDSERQFYAADIRSLSETIRRVANSEYNGRLIFGGGLQTGEVYDSTGTYRGGAEPSRILAGDDYILTTGLTGEEVFGAAGGVDIFAFLDGLATALESGDTDGAHALLGQMDAAVDQISSARAFYGTVTTHGQALLDLYDTSIVQETEAKSLIEDADMAEAYSNLARLDTAFQATLQASAQIQSRTLFDFL